MTDERASFEATKARLEEILAQVKKKDTSLEQSLDLLEEGVRLANECNELIDQTSWKQSAEGEEPEGVASAEEGGAPAAEGGAEDAEADEERAPDAAAEAAEEAGDDTGAGEPAEAPADDERA